MSCPACSVAASSYICPACLKRLVRLYQQQVQQHEQTTLPAAQQKAKAAIAVQRDYLRVQAELGERHRNSTRIRTELARLKTSAIHKRDVLDRRKALLTARRERLVMAQTLLPSSNGLPSSVDETASLPLSDLSQAEHSVKAALVSSKAELAETRRILLSELKEVLQVVPCNGRPDVSYSIGWMPVPRLGLLENLPKQQLNAIVLLLVQLLRLVTFYLGVKLPFVIKGDNVRPLISPAQGLACLPEHSGVCPLYMSSGSTSSQSSTTGGAHREEIVKGTSKPGSSSSVTAASHKEALLIGLAMLAYDAAYLAYLSTPPPPLNPFPEDNGGKDDVSDDILATLAKVCDSPTVGSMSHVWTGSVDSLRDLSWPGMDFATFSKRLRRNTHDSTSDAAGQPTSKQEGTYVVLTSAKKTEKPEQIVVVGEDEWDML